MFADFSVAGGVSFSKPYQGSPAPYMTSNSVIRDCRSPSDMSCLSGTTRKGTERAQRRRATRALPWSTTRHRMGWHQQEAVVSVSIFATGNILHIPFWRFKSRGTRTHLPLIASSETVCGGVHMSIIAMLNTQRTMAISDTVDSDSQRKPNQNKKKDESIHPVSWGSSGDHTSRGRLALSTGFASGSVTFHQPTSVSWSPGSGLATGFEAVDGETKRN